MIKIKCSFEFPFLILVTPLIDFRGVFCCEKYTKYKKLKKLKHILSHAFSLMIQLIKIRIA